jgi:hypothetical protein
MSGRCTLGACRMLGARTICQSLAHVGRAWLPGVPMQLPGFAGREWGIAGVARLVAGKRLVTLAGAGDIGKTRLATGMAAGVEASFVSRVDLVDLTGLPDPAALVGVR